MNFKFTPIRFTILILFSLAFVTFFSTNGQCSSNSGCSVSLRESNNNGMSLLFEINDIEIIPSINGATASIEIDGESGGSTPGAYDLPSITRLIAVPSGVNVRASWTVNDQRTIPSLEPERVDFASPHGDYVWNNNSVARIDQHAKLQPVVDVSEPAIMRGISIVSLSVNPIQYNAENGELEVVDRVNVQLTFEPANDIQDRHNQRNRVTESVANLAKRLVMNPEDIMINRDQPEGSYVYIIPEYEGVREAIEPLVDWRLKQGHETQVIVIEDNSSNREVRDLIMDAYFDWDVPPEIITLVGEADLEAPSEFMIPTWDVGGAYMWETDYKYACLEGDDLLPELAIGRISAQTVGQLEDIVDKIMNYETTPDQRDPEWLRRGAVMSNDQQTGYSSIYLQRWLRKMMLEVGFTEVDTLYFIHNPNRQDAYNFMRANFNSGISLFNYRGWGEFAGAWSIGDARELSNRTMLPLLVMPTCNTADFADHNMHQHSYAEDFLWANGGAVGCIGSSGFTHTNYNNVLDGGIMNGLLRDGNWRFGWALNQGKLELYRHFGAYNDVADPQVRNLLVWEAHCYQFNLIGDAGTQLWTDIPQAIEIEYSDVVDFGENSYAVTVLDEATGEPASNIMVTLVQDGQIVRKGLTDEAGEVLFTFATGELSAGVYELTASQHDVMPVFTEVTVAATDQFLGFSSVIIDDDGAGRSNGNSDGFPNPGERLELRTFIRNFGNDVAQGGVDLTLEVVEGDLAIVEGEIHLNNAPAANDSALATFIVDVGQQNWNTRRAVLNISATNNGNDWNSELAFPIATPNLEYVRHEFTPQNFDTGDTAWVDVTLENLGELASNTMSAQLISNRSVVNVFNDRAEFNPIDPDGNNNQATATFRVHAHSLTVPGTDVSMTILLQDENGFRDTTSFNFTVGEPRHGVPFGPDAYGYVCFDDTDTDWEEGRPVYDWVEIDTALGGPGTDTEITDHGNEEDWSVLVDLPFSFKYYGEDFDQITICSNGWFAFGDESKLADFQNRRIPPALGPRAQVCAFWDDLVNYLDEDGNRIGGIFYWYDEENHRFIIEWSQMRRYVGLVEGELREGAENTFQAILYDTQHYPTYTGDGEIMIQYQTVNNEADVDPLEYDTPYATVGIVNLNSTDGMEYTFWNEYTPGAAVLEDERAIKFSTVTVIVTGSVVGSVVDIEDGEPIPGAEIRGSLGSFAVTDVSGNFIMDHVLIGEDYNFTAWAPGYNDSTQFGFDVMEDSTITLRFALYHPEFELSVGAIENSVQPDYGVTKFLNIANRGNGTLNYRTIFDYSQGDNSVLWENLLDVDLSAITGDTKIQGVNFLGDHFWVCGANNRSNPNKFYLFDRQGRHTSTIDQPGESAYGFRGTAVVDGVIYGGDGEWIIGVNQEGAIVDSIPGPFAQQMALAYDPRGYLFIANGKYDPLVMIDMEGNIIDSWDHELDIQGLGYLRDDPDGYPIYIFSADKTNPALEVPYTLVSKFNPETGSLRSEVVLEGDIYDRAGGMEIINGYDPTKWAMVVTLSNPNGDRMAVYDMGPNTDWVDITPRFGEIAPGHFERLRLELSGENLVLGDYSLILRFEHNAAGLKTDIPVSLHVTEDATIDDEQAIPTEFALGQNYPNPFNAVTTIPFSLPNDAAVRLALYDLQGREVTKLIDRSMKAGYHHFSYDAVDLASGVYIVKLKAGSQTARMKLALIK